jgi:focal adhesion kinase 1
MWSYGMVPYTGWTNDVVIEKVTVGYRLTPPSNCPEDISEMMTSCWSAEPEKRPSFAELNQLIAKVIGPSVVELREENVVVPISANYN